MDERLVTLATFAFCLLALPARGPAQSRSGAGQGSAAAPRLPVPAGRFGIGRIGFDLTDAARADRYTADPHARRELMVWLWYPADQRDPDLRGVYLPGARQMEANAETRQSEQREFEAAWPFIASGAVFSHAVENAKPARSPKRFPVILLSHGLGGTGFEYTALIEDLVSRGYVVAAIEHTGVARLVYFPDGRLIPEHHDPPQPGLSRDEQFKRMVASATAMMVEGAADVRFVLDRLTDLNSGARKQFPLAGRLDFDRVVAAGHSAGAEFAARACELDARFKACIDLDGAMVPLAALPEFSDGATVKQPLLFLEAYDPESRMFGTHEQHQEFFRKKEAQLAACAPGSYDVTLHSAGMFHGSFSDYPLLVAADSQATTTALHNLDLVESFVRAFLSKTFKQTAEPLLDDPHAHPSDADVRPLGH